MATGAYVQAIASREEHPVSRLVRVEATGEFVLEVDRDVTDCRVRVVAPRGVRLTSSESFPHALDEDVTLDGVVPGGTPLFVRLRAAPVVVLDVACDEPFGHLQVEGLHFDQEAAAWGRLGGPQCNGTPVRSAIVPVRRADAVRPLFLWSWGFTCTAVDPRGKDRVEVRLTRGRAVSCTGRGWKPSDRLRVVQRVKTEGAEFPVIWLDGDEVGAKGEWRRDDSPICEIEFRLLREGRVIGTAAVPAGTGPADPARIDLE